MHLVVPRISGPHTRMSDPLSVTEWREETRESCVWVDRMDPIEIRKGREGKGDWEERKCGSKREDGQRRNHPTL